MQHDAASSRKHMWLISYIIRHWHGDLSLVTSYWINGFLARILVLVSVFFFGVFVNRLETDYMPTILWVGAWLIIFVIVTWQLVGIWRSADKHILRTGKMFWANTAKFMVVIGLLSTVQDFSNTGIPAIRESMSRIDAQKWKITILASGSEMELRGGIGNGLAKDLEHTLSIAPGIKLVHVNLANGGLLGEAKKIRDVIHRHRLDTYTSGKCQSACTIVFLGGNERYLRNGAKLGFHSPSFPGLSAEDLADTFREEKKYLSSLGITPDFIKKIFDTPADDMWLPENDELLKSGMITAITHGEQFGFSGIARDIDEKEVEAGLLKNVLFSAISEKEPVLYQEILQTMMAMVKMGASVEDAREKNVPKIRALLVKYTPYASMHSLSGMAELLVQQIDMLKDAPEHLCYNYIIKGNVSSASYVYQVLPAELRNRELGVIADIIKSADLSQLLVSPERKDAAITELVHSLNDREKMVVAQMIQPNPVASYEYCYVMKKLYVLALRLAPYEREAALHALLDR